MSVLTRLLLGLLLVAAVPAGAAPFRFVALGDMPYRLPDDYAAFERLITRINATSPAFSIHIGDIKSGGTPCDDAAFAKILGYFDSFEQPLFYTPGDNEWTDCHRSAAGGFVPAERLARLRTMFFATPQSLGRTRLPYRSQAGGGTFPEMVENALWSYQGVQFATVHVVGSNNGLERNSDSVTEFERRDAANLAWIAETFRVAGDTQARAVVIAFQADPLFEIEKPWEYGNSGFKQTIAALAAGAEAFGRPVLLVHGDSHEFVLDNPLKGSNGQPLRQVWRLEVMGAADVHAVEVTVDPDDAGVFAFRPLIVPENLRR